MGPVRTLLSRPAIWWLLLLSWAGILYYFSSQSNLPSGPDIPHKDKFQHAIYFAGGSFAFAMALFAWRLPVPMWLLLVTGLAFGVITGALDEWHQTFTPGRSGNDLGDWAADIIGSLLGAALVTKLGPFLLPRHRESDSSVK